MATEGVGAPLSPPGTSSPRRVSTSSAPSADDDIVELPKENRPKDKGPALDGGRAGASELPVLAKTEGGLVLVGPGLVVASSIPDLDDDDTDWSARALSAPNRPAPTLAIFVVRFDTKHGNTVEWCYPEDADVDGVEFSCLPSGAHNIHEDVM